MSNNLLQIIKSTFWLSYTSLLAYNIRLNRYMLLLYLLFVVCLFISHRPLGSVGKRWLGLVGSPTRTHILILIDNRAIFTWICTKNATLPMKIIINIEIHMNEFILFFKNHCVLNYNVHSFVTRSNENYHLPKQEPIYTCIPNVNILLWTIILELAMKWN